MKLCKDLVVFLVPEPVETMQYNFKVSKEEKEKIFHTDFVKYGVRHDKAAKAAKILAAGKAEELWTEEEKKLVTQVCQQWLMNHKRYKKLQEHMDL